MGLSAQTLRQTPMDKKRAAIYSRVSTIDQGERFSPGIQQAKLLEKARAEGYTVPPEWMFLDKHTGKDTERPDFERLRKLVKTGAPKAVFALGVDRLARKVVDAAIVAGEFKRYGCILDFVEMRNDDSPEGRFQFTMLAGVAEYMGEKIVEKGIAGHMRMIDEENRIPGHAVLFGHDRHPAEKGRRIKNETEAGYVLKMCQMIDTGSSSWGVAAWLNERGILAKGGHEWSGKTVRQLVSNKSLIGECHTRGKIIPVPRLVPDDLFYRVQKRLAENAKNRAGRHPASSLLSGFILDEQEHRMRAGRKGEGGKYRYYYCGHRTNKPPTYRLCDMPQIKAQSIEHPVFSMVWATITDSERLKRAARAFYQHRQQPGVSTKGVERELRIVKLKYSNIRGMCESGHYEFSEKRSELDALKRRITSLEAELHAIAPVLQMPDERAIEALLRKADASQEPEDFAERRAILDTLQDFKVIYSRSGEFVVTGKCPLGPVAGSKRKVSNWDASEGQNPSSIPFYLKGRVA